MPKCWICNQEIIPKKANAIYSHSSLRYYCKDKDCQKRFIEDAGDPPPEPEDYIPDDHMLYITGL